MGLEEKKFLIAGKSYSRGELHTAGLSPEVYGFIERFLSSDEISVFTSGSTGSPKEIRLSTTHMRESARRTNRYLGLQPGDSCLLCLSPDYIAGMMMLVRWLEGNLNLYYNEPSADPLLEIKAEIDLAAMVPYQVFHSLDHLGRVRNLLVGGGVLAPELESGIRNLQGRVFQSYGMTETITHVALREINPHFQSAYQALEGVRFRTDERSCLVIDAPFLGVEDLVTNDVVRLLDPTQFEWLGRYDNVVNSGGVKIYPEELERNLGDLGVDYLFGGIADPALGQKLVMVLESDDPAIIEQIQTRVAQLPKYHRPREIRLLRKFSRTDSGKLQRHKILKDAFG